MTESANPGHDAAAEDIALMLAVKTGDERAFETLIGRHQFRVVGTVAKMLGGEADAEDLAQQVFIRVWQSAPRYSPSAKFTTWLLTITRNLVFNEMRRRQRARLVPLDPGDADRAPVGHADSAARAAPEEIADAELQEAVTRAIASLPEAQRMAVVLRRFESMPYEEIAKVLGTTVPSVKSLLFRARSDLRERLKAHLVR
ncbi:MAG: sigma-70 family RNA polymerase sigma factor [Terrimicrobiaceae bacterium]|nr:sigma-70 family RNA polymerase sigma factor [Terrimicrobiaceae bacterium]